MDDERFVFIFGSALTAPAHPGGAGIPGVRGIVEMIRNRLTASARTTLDEQLTRDAKANAYQLAISGRFVRTPRGARTR